MVKILYIGGWTRSGSTLLDVLLGQLDGFFSTGELHSIWDRGVLKERHCGCDNTVAECEVWSRVLHSAGPAGVAADAHARRLSELQQRTVRLRTLPRLLLSARRPQSSWTDLREYSSALTSLYDAIHSVTGCRVVVNSSKLAQEAAVISNVADVDPYFLHLIRDPRAVAYSMSRQKMLQSQPGAQVRMPRSSPAESTAGWLRMNIASELVGRTWGADRYMRVRYEDLTSRPGVTLAQIAGFVGEPFTGVSMKGSTFDLKENHTVWGNSSRFTRGPTLVRSDNQWKTAMAPSKKLTATAVALPLLRRYGYGSSAALTAEEAAVVDRKPRELTIGDRRLSNQNGSASGRVKVLYIAGGGRSGSTLLDVLCGEMDGFFSAGEMRWLWWGRHEAWQCGCGKSLEECELWAEILRVAFSDRSELPAMHELLRLQNTAARLHWLPRLLMQSPQRNPRWDSLAAYADVLRRLYGAIAQVTGARVIVDSSKNSPEAAILRLLPNVDPYMIHLVRDPRGVANSMKRKVKMEPWAEKTFEQPRRSTAISALIWTRKNVAAGLTASRYKTGHSLLVRYEDVVGTPAAQLARIASFVGEPFQGLEFSSSSTVTLSANHTAWGNPSRFKRGQVTLRPDVEWRHKLSRRDKAISAALTGPLLLRYGYLGGESSTALHRE